MQYVIPATFADWDWFKSWLSPAITIRQRDEQNQSYIDVVSDVMEDMGLGDYIFTFTDYDKIKLYTYKIDWWSDELTSRYLTGNNELDYYQNKEDFGSQFRGVVGWFSDWLYQEINKIILLLEAYKPKDVDLLGITSILEEIKNKEIPTQDNEELLNKIYTLESKLNDKSDKVEIISTIKSNEANLSKSNEQNRELVVNMLEQIKSDSKTIEELKKYIEKLIARGDISKDNAFKKILKKIESDKEWEELIKEIEIKLLLNDYSFTSLLDN